MFFLIAGLVCSALVSIVLKVGGRWSYDRYGMLAVNYASCLSCCSGNAHPPGSLSA